MTTDPSLLAEATTLVIESVASAVEAAVVGEDASLPYEYGRLCYTAKLLCDALKPYAQTDEEAAREVIEQYGTSTNAGGVR